MTNAKERFLVIGARGFIGSWICRVLVEEGAHVIATDLAPDPRSMRSVLERRHIDSIDYHSVDARDAEAAMRLVGEATHVIYLAGLLRPASEENPLLSSEVSIGGLINLLNAAADRGGDIGISYSSTAAVYGPKSAPDGVITDKSEPDPQDHYGVQRFAMEMTADVFFRQRGLSTIGLRPWVLYGAGRFNGLSAQPSLAMLAAAAGERFHSQFGGRFVVHHVRDVALAFIRAARARVEGSIHANIPGESVKMDEIVEMIGQIEPKAKGKITVEPATLVGAPERVDDPTLERLIGPLPSPTGARVRETIEEYRRLLAEKRISFP